MMTISFHHNQKYFMDLECNYVCSISPVINMIVYRKYDWNMNNTVTNNAVQDGIIQFNFHSKDRPGTQPLI